jgi:hypothetical protein
MRWFAVFGVVLLWISDRGSHFKNEVVQRVQKELKAKHHFTTANCPWSNGTIESACKQVIRAFRAVLSELKMHADEWPEVVNMVQSVLNNYLSGLEAWSRRRFCRRGRRDSRRRQYGGRGRDLHINEGIGDVVDAVVRDGGRVRLERDHVASRGREVDVRRVLTLPSQLMIT